MTDLSSPAMEDRRDTNVESIVSNIALRLRELRRQHNLSLQQLADRAGVSSASIHKIERNGMVPTITTLLKLAEAFDQPLAYFVDEAPDHAGPVAFTPAASRPPGFGSAPGVDVRTLSGAYGGFVLAATVATIAPGTGDELSVGRHGEELVFVLAGVLEFDVDGKGYRLETGDCLHLRTDRPHRWWNAGRQPAEVLWVRPRTL